MVECIWAPINSRDLTYLWSSYLHIHKKKLFFDGLLGIVHAYEKHITLLGIYCVSFVAFMTGCGQKPAPLKQGVVWKVVWSEEPNAQRGLFRVTPAPTNSFGEYGVDMHGRLYPDFIEIQRAGSSHSQIIPLREVLELEFGE